FLAELRKRGFYIAQSGTANYDQTTLCLASALNMNYLKVPDDLLSAREGIRAPIPQRRLIDENLVAAHLRKLGYSYINVWAGLEETRVTTADLVLNARSKATNFESETAGLTALELSPQLQRARYDEHRKFILGGFSELEQVADRRGP